MSRKSYYLSGLLYYLEEAERDYYQRRMEHLQGSCATEDEQKIWKDTTGTVVVCPPGSVTNRMSRLSFRQDPVSSSYTSSRPVRHATFVNKRTNNPLDWEQDNSSRSFKTLKDPSTFTSTTESTSTSTSTSTQTTSSRRRLLATKINNIIMDSEDSSIQTSTEELSVSASIGSQDTDSVSNDSSSEYEEQEDGEVSESTEEYFSGSDADLSEEEEQEILLRKTKYNIKQLEISPEEYLTRAAEAPCAIRKGTESIMNWCRSCADTMDVAVPASNLDSCDSVSAESVLRVAGIEERHEQEDHQVPMDSEDDQEQLQEESDHELDQESQATSMD